MKIEKVELRNEWWEIRSLSPRQFVSNFTPRPLWLTWATMSTYRVQTFNFFKTGTISIILSAFENWKFKQSLTKMIARWMTWQDFPLKRELYFHSDLPSVHCMTSWKWSPYKHHVCQSIHVDECILVCHFLSTIKLMCLFFSCVSRHISRWEQNGLVLHPELKHWRNLDTKVCRKCPKVSSVSRCF